MQIALVAIFVMIAATPLWGRRKVHVWLKKNIPEEVHASDLSEADLARLLSERPDDRRGCMASVGEDRT
jgi:hypothetical protein